jgi:hypothetical protein
MCIIFFLGPTAISFIFNRESLIWSKGPAMQTARQEHSCGRIRSDAGYEIIDITSSQEKN